MIGPDDKEVSRGGERRPIGAMWERGRLAIHRLANRATRLAYKNVRADDSHHKDHFGGLTQPTAPRPLPHQIRFSAPAVDGDQMVAVRNAAPGGHVVLRVPEEESSQE